MKNPYNHASLTVMFTIILTCWFQELIKLKKLFEVYCSLPILRQCPSISRLEPIALQYNNELKATFFEIALLDFYKNYFPLKNCTLLGSIYLYGQLFSFMKQIKMLILSLDANHSLQFTIWRETFELLCTTLITILKD